MTEIDELWPTLAPFVDKGLKATDEGCSLGEAWVKCRGGYAFLLVVLEDTKILSVSIWEPLGETFHCLTMSGHRMSAWFTPLKKQIYMMAKMCGAVKITARGRDGWKWFFGPKNNTGEYEVFIQ